MDLELQNLEGKLSNLIDKFVDIIAIDLNLRSTQKTKRIK